MRPAGKGRPSGTQTWPHPSATAAPPPLRPLLKLPGRGEPQPQPPGILGARGRAPGTPTSSSPRARGSPRGSQGTGSRPAGLHAREPPLGAGGRGGDVIRGRGGRIQVAGGSGRGPPPSACCARALGARLWLSSLLLRESLQNLRCPHTSPSSKSVYFSHQPLPQMWGTPLELFPFQNSQIGEYHYHHHKLVFFFKDTPPKKSGTSFLTPSALQSLL